MSHTHAHAVFIELTFGLNTVFSVYQDFNKKVTDRVDEKIEKLVAEVQTVEQTSTTNSETRVETVSQQMKAMRSFHLDVQRYLYDVIVWFAIAGGMAGLLILYFDWIARVEWWCGLLLTPFASYLLFSIINYVIFWGRGQAKLQRLRQFHSEFDPPPPPTTAGGAAAP